MNRTARGNLFAAVGLAAFAFATPAKAQNPPPPLFDWSGFYIGVNAGYAWGKARATDIVATNGLCWAGCGTVWNASVNGFTGGAQAGWNIQIQNWVLGIEGDVGYLGLSGRAPHPNTATTFLQSDGGWFATLRGRIGVLFSPTVLFYGTGGIIFADPDTRVVRNPDLNTGNPDGVGWTGGAGLEVRLSPNWSWKVEWLYYDLGTDRVGSTFAGGGTAIQFFNIEQTGNIIRTGLNWRM